MASNNTMTTDSTARRVFDQSGSTIGSSNVNYTSAGSGSTFESVLTFTMPRKFRFVNFDSRRMETRARLRGAEKSLTPAADGTVSLSTNIQPIAGETDIGEQPYPVVVLVDDSDGSEVEITEVDYAQNEVSTGLTDTDTVHAYPILYEGEVKLTLRDRVGNRVGALSRYPTHISSWVNHDMLKEGNKVYTQGSANLNSEEEFEIRISGAETDVVWTDPDYPEEFVSHIEQVFEVGV